MISYPINCNTKLILVYNVRLFNSSPAVVVLIGRLMHGVMSIAPPSLRYKIYVHIRIIVWSSRLSWPVDLTKFSCLLLLPWYTAITGYHMSSDNSNSHQKPMAGYRQMSKSLLDTSQPRKKAKHHKWNIRMSDKWSMYIW